MTPSDTELDRQIDEVLKPMHDAHCRFKQGWFPGQKEDYPCDCYVGSAKAQIKQLVTKARLDTHLTGRANCKLCGELKPVATLSYTQDGKPIGVMCIGCFNKVFNEKDPPPQAQKGESNG